MTTKCIRQCGQKKAQYQHIFGTTTTIKGIALQFDISACIHDDGEAVGSKTLAGTIIA